MDLHWPGICIFEMKAPGREVAAGRDQVKRYWEQSADEEQEIPAARWVVICSFQKFEIWEPGYYPSRPRRGRCREPPGHRARRRDVQTDYDHPAEV